MLLQTNESLKEIIQQKLDRQMNSEEGNPFRSFNLEQEFQKHNEGISINKGDSMPKVYWGRGKQLQGSLPILFKGLSLVLNL